MVRTIERREGSEAEGEADFRPNGGRVPRLSGDIRHLIPTLGLREYWYPALGARSVSRRRPVRQTMLGEDLCFFRDASGAVVALSDVCPHRGARLSEGDCHFAGTVACPYHGWVFDGDGKNVAVLAEGPDAIVTGKPGTEARKYPTCELKGVVFVWMGEGEPAPIEEDVPEEFFRPEALILFNDRIIWKTNWEVALENSMDAHVQYLHRDNLRALLAGLGSRSGGSQGQRPIYTGNGFLNGSVLGRDGKPLGPLGVPRDAPLSLTQDEYARGWKWPKNRHRRLWNWFFGPLLALVSVPAGPVQNTAKWSSGHHLPGMFRAGSGGVERSVIRSRTGGSLFGLYTRQVVAMEEWKTRVWYFHYSLPKGRLQRWWHVFNYFTLGRWTSEYNFSQQDMSVMLNQRFDAPEKLSGTDAEVVQWRRLVVTRHFGGRNAPFQYANSEGDPREEPAEQAEALAGVAAGLADG
jgi:nitrite reductase/ring-hydroxylating ferredoxin subunit